MICRQVVASSRRLCILTLFLFVALLTTATAGYKNAYEADEALLEVLAKRRLSMWIAKQLEYIKKTHSGRTDDLQYLSAIYAGPLAKVLPALKKIPESSTRYADARMMVARYTSELKEKIKILDGVRQSLQGDNSKKDLLEKVTKMLVNAYIEDGQIDQALKLLEGGNSDKRFLAYMSAKLKFMKYDKLTAMDAANKTALEAAIKALINSPLLWQRDYMGVLGYCELAHGYILQGKPKKAMDALKAAHPVVKAMHPTFKGAEAIHTPMAPFLYYLARCYELQYAKSAKTKETAVQFLGRAGNIYQASLQKGAMTKTPYARDALKRLEDVKKLLEGHGIKTKEGSKDVKRDAAFLEGKELYRKQKYEEALPKLVFGCTKNGKLKSDHAQEGLLYITACYYKTKKWDDAQKAAMTYIKNYKTELRAWDALYNAALNTLRGAKEIQDEKESARVKGLAVEMFTYLAKNNKNHPKAYIGAWMVAEGYWGSASELRKQKKQYDLQIKKTKTQEARNDLIRKRNEVITKIRAEYKKAIPAYQVLVDYYSNTNYGVLALYKIAWIHYISDDKDKAVESFTKYVNAEKTKSANYIDAKYITGDILFRQNRLADAQKLFSEVIKLTEDGAYELPARAALHAGVKKRVAKARKGGFALRPWCKDKQGQDKIDRAEELIEEAEELESVVKDYESAYEANKDKAAVADLRAPIPPKAIESQSKEFEPGKLPKDYALREYLMKLGATSNLCKELGEEVENRVIDGRLYFIAGTDVVVTVPSKAAQIKISNTAAYWSTSNPACYRGGKLIGVYDTTEQMIVKANEALKLPETIEVPALGQTMPILEVAIRTRRMRALVDQKLREAKKQRDQGLKDQTEGLKEMEAFTKMYPKDKVFAPANLFRIAIVYVNRQDWDNAAKQLDALQRKYPSSQEAQKAPIYLFRSFMKAGKMQEALKQAEKLMTDLPTMNESNLVSIAFKIFKVTPKLELDNPGPNLSLAALDEVLKRGGDSKRLKRLEEKALFYKGRAYYLLKDHTNALAQIDKLLAQNDKTAYRFKLLTLKGKVLLAQKKHKEALKPLNEVIGKTSGNRDKFKVAHWGAVVEVGKVYMATQTKASLNKALLRYQHIIEYTDAKDPALRGIREFAYYWVTQLHAKLGEMEKAAKVRAEYLRTHPEGVWRKDIATLAKPI